MNSYFEINLLPNEELSPHVLIGLIMQELHYELINYDGKIAVAFPRYNIKIGFGHTIRILGSQDNIKNLHKSLLNNNNIRDYSILENIAPIPSNITLYVEYKRIHEYNASRLRRLKKRYTERGIWTTELEQQLIDVYKPSAKYPWINLKSDSTKQSKFSLFIKEFYSSNSKQGMFNSYGLSINGANVPKF